MADPDPVPHTGRLTLPGCPDPARFWLWPGLLMALVTAAGFSIFKFIVIGEIALTRQTALDSMPFDWLRLFVERMPQEMPLSEAVGQALSAVFTLGILIGYAFNAPLAGAWRVAPLYILSCVGMLVAAFLPLLGGAWPWYAAMWIGGTYGIACAARGKSIPLMAAGTGRHNTFVSGLVNAGLVVGLLIGTITGSNLAKLFIGDPHAGNGTVGTWIDADWIAHAVLAVFLVGAAACGFLLRIPDEQPTPFLIGLRKLFATTWRMMMRHWALLISGGIAWGIMAALAITAFIYAVKVIHIDLAVAWMPALAAGTGAIVGSLVSHRFTRRRWVLGSFIIFAILISAFPFIVDGSFIDPATRVIDPRTGAIDPSSGKASPLGYALMCMMTFCMGATHMIPTNVVDARYLAIVGEAGEAGSGSTVFSMVHNLFILLIGTGMAILLFTNVLDERTQFMFLGLLAVCAAAVAGFAQVRR